MPKSKTKEIKATILRLLDEEPEVNIRLIAKTLKVSKDDGTERKAIGRALLSLVAQNLIIPKNSGRSRVYVKFAHPTETKQSFEPIETVTAPAAKHDPFEGIELSRGSRSLLSYVSQGINKRIPVSYNQDFLRSYEPNRTFYLTAAQREKLLGNGRVEAIESCRNLCQKHLKSSTN